MSRKSLITIVIGLLVITATLWGSNLLFDASAPADTETTQMKIEKFQQRETIHTSFLFLAILELLVIGVLAHLWRTSDIPHRYESDNHEESPKKISPTAIQFSVYAGIIAFATSHVASLLDVFVFDVYGGLTSFYLFCTGIPAVLFGMLGGMVWHKYNRKSKYAPIDFVQLILIGIVAGLIAETCPKFLPQ